MLAERTLASVDPLALDDLLALSGLSPREMAAELGLSVRELHAACREGAAGYVAERLAEFEATLPQQWRLGPGGQPVPEA